MTLVVLLLNTNGLEVLNKQKSKIFGARLLGKGFRDKRTRFTWKGACKTKKTRAIAKIVGSMQNSYRQVTKTNILILDDFKLEDLQIETHYLNNTVAPNLKIKNRRDADPVTKNIR